MGIESTLISGILVVIAVAVLNKLWHRVKQLGEPIVKGVTEKDCDNCNGAGKITCTSCSGKGSIKKIMIDQGRCSLCNGLGFVTPPCPTCAGSGITFRKLRYEGHGTQGIVESRGILWWQKRFQVMTISIRNVDDKAGKFTGTVTLQDGNNTTKQEGTFLRAGEYGAIRLEFEVTQPNGFPSTYDVIPEQLQFNCTICSGSGKIQKSCNGCQGTGQVPAQREITETCTVCAGTGQIVCASCQGTGKTKRI